MEPNRKVRKQGLEHFIKFVRELPSPSPQAMFQALHELGYRGQDHARRALCLMAYRHVKRIKRIYVDGVDRAELPRKSNFLFVGPTGSGKTFLVETPVRQDLEAADRARRHHDVLARPATSARIRRRS